MKKRYLFVGAMVVLALNAYAADSDFTVDANGVITKYAGFDTEVTIPTTIGGKKITAIGKESFRKADLTSVVIPDGITEIGEYAFAANKLTTVTIPGSVKTIADRAFDDNQDLATVVLSEGLETVGGAFPSTVKNINIPASIRSFDAILNSGTSVTFAANIIVDLDKAFRRAGEYGPGNPAIFFNYIANDRNAGTYTQDMKCDVKKADGYTYYETQYGAVISDYSGDSTRLRVPAQFGDVVVKATYALNSRGVFQYEGIVALQIPEGITYIGPKTFSGNKLQSVTLPQSVIYIGDSAFADNELAAIDIPAGVRYIGSEAFLGNKLTTATISTGVQYIGALAFANTYEQESAYGFSRYPYSNFNELTSVTIPTSVTYIGKSAFNGIKAIIVPTTVKTMGGFPIAESIHNHYNDGNKIVIGTNVLVQDTNSSFAEYYNNNGRKAGRYTAGKNVNGARIWVYSAQVTL